MNLKFVCGCTTGDVVARDNLKTMDAVTIDDDGFLTCAIHHQRMYGWRSITLFATSKVQKWEHASVHPLHIQNFLVFGEPIPEIPVRVEDHAVKRDTRDLRTTEELVVKTRSKKYGFGVRVLR